MGGRYGGLAYRSGGQVYSGPGLSSGPPPASSPARRPVGAAASMSARTPLAPLAGGRISDAAKTAAASQALRLAGQLGRVAIAYDLYKWYESLYVPGASFDARPGHYGFDVQCTTGDPPTHGFWMPFGTCGSVGAVAGLTPVTPEATLYSGWGLPNPANTFWVRVVGYIRQAEFVGPANPQPSFWPDTNPLPFPFVDPVQNGSVPELLTEPVPQPANVPPPAMDPVRDPFNGEIFPTQQGNPTPVSEPLPAWEPLGDRKGGSRIGAAARGAINAVTEAGDLLDAAHKGGVPKDMQAKPETNRYRDPWSGGFKTGIARDRKGRPSGASGTAKAAAIAKAIASGNFNHSGFIDAALANEAQDRSIGTAAQAADKKSRPRLPGGSNRPMGIGAGPAM